MRGKHVVDKLSPGLAEAEGKRTGTRKLSGNWESSERSPTEIRVEYASTAISNYFEWTHYRICSHWQTRGKRFKQHEAKGVGQTWEHEYVGARVGGGKPLIAHFADEMGSGKALLKLLPRRSVSNDDLWTRQIQWQESVEILSTATRAHVRKIGLGNSKMLAARGRKRLQSTPRDHRIKRRNPWVSSSRPNVSVDTIMPEPALWNRRSRA
jgi:hypothetical protein